MTTVTPTVVVANNNNNSPIGSPRSPNEVPISGRFARPNQLTVTTNQTASSPATPVRRTTMTASPRMRDDIRTALAVTMAASSTTGKGIGVGGGVGGSGGGSIPSSPKLMPTSAPVTPTNAAHGMLSSRATTPRSQQHQPVYVSTVGVDAAALPGSIGSPHNNNNNAGSTLSSPVMGSPRVVNFIARNNGGGGSNSNNRGGGSASTRAPTTAAATGQSRRGTLTSDTGELILADLNDDDATPIDDNNGIDIHQHGGAAVHDPLVGTHIKISSPTYINTPVIATTAAGSSSHARHGTMGRGVRYAPGTHDNGNSGHGHSHPARADSGQHQSHHARNRSIGRHPQTVPAVAAMYFITQTW
jgi:hypothetical protein